MIRFHLTLLFLVTKYNLSYIIKTLHSSDNIHILSLASHQPHLYLARNYTFYFIISSGPSFFFQSIMLPMYNLKAGNWLKLFQKKISAALFTRRERLICTALANKPHPTSFPRSPVSPSLRWRGPPSAQTCTSARSRRRIASRGARASRIRTWPRTALERARKRPLSLELKQALIWTGEREMSGREAEREGEGKTCCKWHVGYLGRASMQVPNGLSCRSAARFSSESGTSGP